MDRGHQLIISIFDISDIPAILEAVDGNRLSIISLDGERGDDQIRMKDRKDSLDDVFVVDLEKWQEGLGLGLIDGMVSIWHYLSS